MDSILSTIGILALIGCAANLRQHKLCAWKMVLSSVLIGFFASIFLTITFGFSMSAAGENSWFLIGLISIIISNYLLFKSAKTKKDKKITKRGLIIRGLIFLVFIIGFSWLIITSTSCEFPEERVGLECCIKSSESGMCVEEEKIFFDKLETAIENNSFTTHNQSLEENYYKMNIPEGYIHVKDIKMGGIDVLHHLSAIGETETDFVEIIVMGSDFGSFMEEEFEEEFLKGLYKTLEELDGEILDDNYYENTKGFTYKLIESNVKHQLIPEEEYLYQVIVLFNHNEMGKSILFKYISSPGYEGYVEDFIIMTDSFEWIE